MRMPDLLTLIQMKRAPSALPWVKHGGHTGRKGIMAVTLMAGLALAGCQNSAPPDGPLRSTARAAGFATTTPEPKDFVRESRTGEQNFIPVGSSISRPARKMTPQEFQAIERDLDAQRTKNETAGASAKAAGATPPPAPLKLPPPQ